MMRLFIALAVTMANQQIAAAQTSDELIHRRRQIESSEYASVEVSVGTYAPNTGAVGTVFPDDRGPAVNVELDAWILRIPKLGQLGFGFRWTWARFAGPLCTDPACQEDRATQEGELVLYPMATMAVLRIDALAREHGIPLVFSGKAGIDTLWYRSSGGTDGRGLTLGFRWAGQVALELDFINPRRARVLDEEYGINHTSLFLELYGSTGFREVHFATRLGWAVGLGIHF